MAEAQQTMKQRTLLILVLIFLGLAAIVLTPAGDDNGSGAATPTLPTFLRVYPNIAVLDILAVRISDPSSGDVLTFRREDDGTWVADEVAVEIDQEIGTGVARTVALLPYTQTIDPPPNGDLAQFGFRVTSDGEVANFNIQIFMTDGSIHFVAIGDPLQIRPDFYALVDDRSEIYTIQRSAIDYLAGYLDTLLPAQ
jgi:hypothetical protein